MTQERFVILCAAADPAVAASLRNVIDEVTGEHFDAEVVANGAALPRRVSELAAADIQVPVVAVTDQVGDGTGTDALRGLEATPDGFDVRTVLVTADASAVTESVVDAVVALPWDDRSLQLTFDRLITSYLIDEEPEALEQVPEVVDVELLSHAYSEADQRSRAARNDLVKARRGILNHRELTDDEIEAAMIEEIERVMDNPPRTTFPAGSRLITSGQDVDGVMILLDGQIKLSLEVDGEEMPFHVRTAGRILGILSLARDAPAYFDCTALSDVTVVEISSEELDDALLRSATLAGLFVSVLLRSMVRRNRRGVEMRMQINRLAHDIGEERDQLALALQQLDSAQSKLIEQEKMALLGQLVAGVAHELNNPVAAITRATEFIQDDVTTLTREHPESRLVSDILLGALTATPVSTKQQRQLRRTLGAALGDDDLAQRYVEVGLTTPDAVDRVFGRLSDRDRDALLGAVERYHQLGTSIRNLRTASRRIADLVQSLRSYGRKRDEATSGVDVRQGLEETLLLLGHQMRGITIRRDYGDVATITGYPGELNQVWTNLIVNAVQAMEGEGTLQVHTDQLEPNLVRVRVVDDGPGIPIDHVERIFELDFTTKKGRVDFGLGLGLRIAQDIVTRHEGSIQVESEPGFTCFSVILPTNGGMT